MPLRQSDYEKVLSEMQNHPLVIELEATDDELRPYVGCWHYGVMGPAGLARHILAKRWEEESE